MAVNTHHPYCHCPPVYTEEVIIQQKILPSYFLFLAQARRRAPRHDRDCSGNQDSSFNLPPLSARSANSRTISACPAAATAWACFRCQLCGWGPLCHGKGQRITSRCPDAVASISAVLPSSLRASRREPLLIGVCTTHGWHRPAAMVKDFCRVCRSDARYLPPRAACGRRRFPLSQPS